MSKVKIARGIRGASFAIGAFMIVGDMFLFGQLWPILAGLIIMVVGEVVRDVVMWIED
jgi:hypothetical protein